jgi:hypothetical protein
MLLFGDVKLDSVHLGTALGAVAFLVLVWTAGLGIQGGGEWHTVRISSLRWLFDALAEV